MASKPNITVSSLDVDRLERLMSAPSAKNIPSLTELEDELDRADVVEPQDMPANVVTMNSKVKFRDESTGKEFTLTLVYPDDKHTGEGTISIFAPVGSALLGLTEGDQIAWPKPGGGSLSVRILEIVYQPERAGELHR